MRAKRYTFKVVIEQDLPEGIEIPFGAREQWAEIIKSKLDSALLVANVVSVTPMRNLKGDLCN